MSLVVPGRMAIPYPGVGKGRSLRKKPIRGVFRLQSQVFQNFLSSEKPQAACQKDFLTSCLSPVRVEPGTIFRPKGECGAPPSFQQMADRFANNDKIWGNSAFLCIIDDYKRHFLLNSQKANKLIRFLLHGAIFASKVVKYLAGIREKKKEKSIWKFKFCP